ncbi:dihydroceramide delta-4-desaturase [Laetiporus sulphureus 93-53]|uniref:Dihydroceramide delta-4-desaturase n=1 Tax=Laetiporus sulphureus 93-53 TaxID=1314785 RepID=A0A165CJB9_9APHY|nr:dihydroceramide delta-4-desaturase [Laetiporus sulphureus 93-53]KZT02914.1 dihydroceramide delta-4-desaturase [Laetiporus sulphureus 93-53]
MAVPSEKAGVGALLDISYFGGAKSLSEGRSPHRTVVASPTAQDDGKHHIAPPQDPSDFLWIMMEEPHRSCRTAIMKAHPEVKKLMGCEPLTKYVVFSNHNLFLAIHEISHNLAFKGIWANKALSVFANLSIGVPYCAAFKRYHMEHHKYLGEDGIDTDLPTHATIGTFHIFFYALRPGFVRTQRIIQRHITNLIVQVIFDYVLVKTCGVRPLIYLLASSFFAGSLHPCAGHFIAEHYVWDGLLQETYSYYGPLNILACNVCMLLSYSYSCCSLDAIILVGYHNEHHDFPSVAWTRLPALRALAPEFYDTLPSHPSWPTVTINFIRDPEVTIFARVKRPMKGKAQPVQETKQPKNAVKDASDSDEGTE